VIFSREPTETCVSLHLISHFLVDTGKMMTVMDIETGRILSSSNSCRGTPREAAWEITKSNPRTSLQVLDDHDGPSPEEESSLMEINVQSLLKEIDAKNGVAQFDLEISFEFRNLTYTVPNTRRTLFCALPKFANCAHPGDSSSTSRHVKLPASPSVTLLQNLSGKARDGEILAVMGPSGSGKSTLIDALAQRISREKLSGSITLNGQEVDGHQLRNISAYVMQDDLLFPMLTVQETLTFSASVRLPACHTKAAKRARVSTLLRQLGLEKVADTIIGDEGCRGISGGERRRVSIGVDIVHGPLLLFLDEPTSGLDSSSAYMVVKTMKHIADMGSIVIMSVHQPSDRILGLIQNLMFLANGQMIYMGHPKDLTDYFTKFNHGYPIPSAHGNAAEFALDLIQVLNCMPGGIKPLVDRFKSIRASAHEHSSSATTADQRRPCDLSTSSKAVLHPAIPTGISGAIAASIAKGRLMSTSGYVEHCNDSATLILKFANSRWHEIGVLIWRCIANIRRTPELFYTRLGTVIGSGLLLSTIFWQLDHSPKGLQERLGFFAFAMSFTYYSCVDTLPIFLQERFIFMRETSHNAYRKSSYVLANAIVYIPFLGVLSLAFAVTTFWGVGLSGGVHGFLFFFLIIWASFWSGNSFATFLSAIIPNVILGYTVVVAVLAYFLLLSGFFRSRDRIPDYWLWFHYMSLIKYPYEAVVRNELMNSSLAGDNAAAACYETAGEIFSATPLSLLLSQPKIVTVLEYLRQNYMSGTAYQNLNTSTCMIDGAAVLQNQSITQLGKWSCLGITVAFGALYRLLFYVALIISAKNSRR